MSILFNPLPPYPSCIYCKQFISLFADSTLEIQGYSSSASTQVCLARAHHRRPADSQHSPSIRPTPSQSACSAQTQTTLSTFTFDTSDPRRAFSFLTVYYICTYNSINTVIYFTKDCFNFCANSHISASVQPIECLEPIQLAQHEIRQNPS